MKKIQIGILGATSYTGAQLLRLLAWHEQAEAGFVSSQTYAGQAFPRVFPEMLGICDMKLIAPEETAGKNVDCVFSCLPHAVSAQHCIPFIKKGIKVIDLSADFRIKDAAVYTKWYKETHPCPDKLKEAVFGLPEHYRAQIVKAKICANPGCYPTSILLPVLPLLKEKGALIGSIIADSKSGVSGAGRTLKLNTHFAEANETFSAYSVGRVHRHIAEVDQELSIAAGHDIQITFSPHLLPVNRGILSTIYLQTNKTAQECQDIVSKTYAKEPFVRMRKPDDLPNLRDVVNTNYCDISFTGGGDGQPVIAVSTIDNLIKGASGQALQNMNIMFGFPETMGLLK